MDRDLLLEKGVEAFLKEHKRELMIERYELLSRYEVSSLEELKKKKVIELKHENISKVLYTS